MSSRKRLRTAYSSYDDEDPDLTLVQEEQTIFEETRSRKRTTLSLAPSHTTKAHSNILKGLSTDDVDRDLDDFFTSTVHEIADTDIDPNKTLVADAEPESSDDELEDDSDDEELDEDVAPKKSRYKSLDDFRALSTEFIEQFMRRYCPTSVSESCSSCGVFGEALVCTDCILDTSRCQDCFVKDHKHLPFHRVQFFDGGTWQKTTLRELGLILYLGHNGTPCPTPSEAKNVIVIDINGIQEICVSFCSCEKVVGVDATERSQLINRGWFPATTEHPGTVATFAVLDAFEALSGEGKLSGYHFYKSIIRLKDGAGYENIPRRYEEFMRMTREYQHLKMLLRAGKTTGSDTPSTIADGELAVQCPACPHPGRNIPEDWDKRIDSWLYTLFIMIDANFRLKSKKKRTVDDPDLGDGKSYFVRQQPYMQHVQKTVDEKEIKYCDSGLRAVDHANLKGGKGYSASGVVGVQCRHMLIRANGFGDLQKGEKYANVDYVLLSSLKGTNVRRIVLSYDIVCQYNRNFKKRLMKFDDDLRLDLSKIRIGFVIPQFHIAGHGASCRTTYNLRFREHVGRTDGENIERGWAALNPLSMASKEMGSGARHDYIDWHIGDWNYQRIVSFGRLFSRKLKEAVAESVKHSKVFDDFRRSFPKAIVKDVEDAIRVWDEDPKESPNPYATISVGKLMAATQKKLTEAERREEITSIFSDVASETQWLVVGLELEDSQYSIKKLHKEKGKASSSTMSEKNMQALHKIRDWKSDQLLHMPRASVLPGWQPLHEHEKRSLLCWKINLLLPSSIPSPHRQFSCSDKLIDKEYQLRVSQAHDALMELRHLLQKEWWLRSKKKKHVSGPGQKINTKSNAAIDVVVEQRGDEVARYRRARNALEALQPQGRWQMQYRILRDEDVRHFEDGEGKGEGRRTPSWIWITEGATTYRYEEDANAYEGLKVEYAKARARTFRWLEEVQLIKEEMRRVLCYFNWKIGWWLDRNSQLTSRDQEAALGAIVYNNRQVLILQQLGNKFRQQWQVECDLHDLPKIRSDAPTMVKKVSKVPRVHQFV